MGTDGAPIEIIQFAEFQCPYCGKVGDTMEQLLAAYPGKLKIVYRDFPLGFHDRAIPAAIAANCAGEQDKYWDMHGVLMANQTKLSDSDLAGFAQGIGVDMDKWTACLSNPAQEAEVGNSERREGHLADDRRRHRQTTPPVITLPPWIGLQRHPPNVASDHAVCSLEVQRVHSLRHE